MFHIGHASTLEKAKKLGTYLVVGVHDDATVRENEGGNVLYPIQTLYERVLSVLSCKHVDNVVVGASRQLTQSMINTLKINKVVFGTVGSSRKWDEKQRIHEVSNGRVQIETVQSDWDLTVETIAERVLKLEEVYEKRNEKRVKIEADYYAEQQKEADGKAAEGHAIS